ncbi:prolipoprotein diacylglyceryl transferase [Acidithiobacillus sp. CV18-2]|uniref:Phosphatidylglycerol--prolipoprotein diacylglyceryl transferase n=1 Tax=Igneacidithiobacillus copahuensis TaxID=2724909 RepID=A0AAE2YRL2_9PROT|nr:prolipoprotein diacylglyceryl transferase [Igneacidithiobacillus copahuensis]MBU2753282.1 prolipoprotein diacylglyceryl transferase [Acidithiobacillus sp. CV18-3]MBU2756312.1 prolipoprotein diacylglyceryl transferase [Acidithiobacillus sp. BN09-2]MBU2776099.1 prolipoprotein diacylglyceryl transferase [Acidithiobacillus sp. CV18-2]MBU2795712.1 prolipoprotein diacylglyceryl transferase [Acidithiobacillus sp. VAN18-2]MBU2798706.1 prolipoprotein diacylglyceryl transferase [Acidithiobacillus sp.
MLHYPNINPMGFQLGPITIHWYGLLEIISFVIATLWLIRRGRRSHTPWKKSEVVDLEFFVAIGAILGGRVGYVLWYNLPYYVQHPLHMLYIWDGGMSFHGGLLGVVLACWLFAKGKPEHDFLPTLDFIAPAVPIGLGLGRIANFINDQLFGRVSHLPWAMVFPAGGPQPRQPSQIYEFLLEGVLLFLILAIYSRRPRPIGAVGGLFVFGYGVFRFLVEFVRQPDIQLGFVLGPLTMGQVLSIPMIILGPVIIWWAYRGGFAKQEEQSLAALEAQAE